MEAFLNQPQQSNGGHERYSTRKGKSLFVQTRGQRHFVPYHYTDRSLCYLILTIKLALQFNITICISMHS